MISPLTAHRSPLLTQYFAFAHGRIGVLQQLLLTQIDVDRLLGATDLADASKILTELKMTSLIDQSLNTSEEILSALGEWIRTEIALLSPISKRSTFDILWLEEEGAQVAHLLKEHHGLTNDKNVENRMSNIELPEYLTDFAEEMKLLENPTPQEIDNKTAQFITKKQLHLAKKSVSKAILSYVQHRIDLHNIRTSLRLQNSTFDIRHSTFLLDGGTIKKESLSGDIHNIQKVVDRSPLAFTLSDDLLDLSQDPGALEQSLSQITALDIAHLWNIPLDQEPVFAFGAIALSHITLLRVLLMGKRNSLSPQEIKKMIPPFLPASHYISS
jgi:vacuolar-type H+-ATPase subunit C/Vma6